MKSFLGRSSSTLLTMTMLTAASPALVQANAIEEAFKGGKATFDARYRYESVDDSTNLDATASTLRTGLGFTTDTSMALSAHADFEHVSRVLLDREYGAPYAVVADPNTSELNQAYLKYKVSDSVTAIAGRQRIILDNARFVGNVVWRQNEVTFDALRVMYKPSKDISLDFINIQQVNTLLGTDVESNHNLINAGFSGIGPGKLTAYAYMLSNDGAAASETQTLGLRYKGKSSGVLYTAEFATYSDTGDNPSSFDSDYTFLELGYKFSDKITAFIASETLGADDGVTGEFETPLATKHAFNGWADKFLNTPATGLVDNYIKVVSKVAGVKIVGMYHDYSADFGSADYGTELNLVVVKKLDKNFTVLGKYASYDADSFSADTEKLWFQVQYKLAQ